MTLLLLLVVFLGSVFLTAVSNMLTEDISQWITSAARWNVRWYAAKWPAAQKEQIEEQGLADLNDTRGIVHIVRFVVGLWLRIGQIPVETLPGADTSEQSEMPPLSAHLTEHIRVSDSVTIALTGVSATGEVGSVTAMPFSNHDASNQVVRRMRWDAWQRRSTGFVSAPPAVLLQPPNTSK